jgi:ADP-ribose pyrophosphatase YjhB (NUDIX family)
MQTLLMFPRPPLPVLLPSRSSERRRGARRLSSLPCPLEGVSLSLTLSRSLSLSLALSLALSRSLSLFAYPYTYMTIGEDFADTVAREVREETAHFLKSTLSMTFV